MASAIIETKLVPTFVCPDLLPRDRLVRRLLDGAPARLVVVQGEAGAGKSTLLYDFVRRSKTPVAWYSLQETDCEPRVFLAYLCEALGRAFPGAVRRARELLHAPAGMPVPDRDVVIALVNDLAEYGHRTAIVLDDYHLVQDTPAVADLISFLVWNAPASLQLILATRTRPDLKLPYLRAKGMLAEVSGEQLRFTASEVEKVFSEVWGVPVDHSLARLLHEKTEGWITGLQLVSQAVRGRGPGEIRRYVEELGGKEQYVYDYLATEVYAQQPPEVQRFLRATAVLARFDADLAEAVTGDPDCRQRLEHLEHCQLFLVHLDANREWFRYHHLFGDFLRRRLEVEDGAERMRALHLEAARWLERAGDPAAAVPHFLQAGDARSAIRVIEQRGGEMLAAGHQGSLEGWIDALPRELRDVSATITVLRADLRDLSGDWARAVELYELAVRQLRQDGRGAESARVLESLMLCLLRYGETDRVVQTCEAALAAVDTGDLAQRSSLKAWLGAILVYSGRDWERGYALIRDSHQLAFRSGDPRAISQACITYGFAYHFPQGNFQLAEQAFNEGIELFRSLGWTPTLYQLLMNKSVVLIFQGRLKQAAELVEDTIMMAERAGHSFIVQALEMNRAHLFCESLDFHRCAQSFNRLSGGAVPAQIRPWYYRTLMLYHVFQDNREQARVAAEEMMRVLGLNGRGMYAPECLVSLGYYHYRGREYDSAVRVLQEALELSEQGQCRFWQMKACFLLAAICRDRYGDTETMRRHLQHALTMSRENDYAEFWPTDPTELAFPLLVDAVSLDLEAAYARALLARWGDAMYERMLTYAAHPIARVRSVALEMLGKVGSEAAVSVLRGARRDRAKQVRATAAKTLRARAPSRVKLEIYTLGAFRLLRNGEPVDLKRRRTQNILKYLLARFDSSTSIEAIMETFWPDQDPGKSRRNTQVHLNYIRRLLNPEGAYARFLIVRRGDEYEIHLDDDTWLDLADFDRLVREGATLRLQGDEETAQARFLRAEALYDGHFLEADAYDDWLLPRRQRTAQQYREVATFLAERALDGDNAGEAAAWYRRLLARDPLDEGALQSLLRCYAALGDRTSARRDYEAFSQQLASEMDMEPSAATRLLADRLQVWA